MILMHSPKNRAAKSNQSNKTDNRPTPSVETAGSLALWQQGLLMANLYDSFEGNNPFAVDYSMYSFVGEGVVAEGGFLSSFSNAVSTLGDSGFGGFSDGGFSGASSGGFASVC